MAEELNLKVKLETELGKVTGDINKLKGAGAFGGEAGAKNLNRIQGILTSLQAVDLSKLKGTDLTSFLNSLSKLRHYLDTAAKGLTNFSADYKKALDRVEQATLKASKAQDTYNQALEKQRDAQSRLKLQDTIFKNAKGNRVSNPDTLADLFQKNELRVFNAKNQELYGAAKDKRLESSGIVAYAQVSQEVNKFQKELEAANKILETAKTNLEKTPVGSDLHPVTKDVVTTSVGTNQIISGIKEEIGQDTSKDIEKTNVELANLNTTANQSRSSLGRAFKQFTLYAIALRTVKKALHEAIGTIKDLDKYLTEQAMVTGRTRKETYALLKNYQDMAASLGTTTREVAEVATQFMRQGKTTADALTLTTAAISAAKVAGISATESVNYLTTALNGFQLSAQQAMEVSDKFASIAARSATSYEEIATALSKVAAQANMAGMSIDYTTALLAKGIETTREAPETIGTALKTVIARMRELTDYGATLEDGMNINNVETQLAYVGIALRNTNGELRSTEDVLNDLGKQWDTLNSNQQAAIAKALAGTRQQSRLIAMMTDYERVTELQQIAERSAGATAAQAEVYMEGMEAALNRVSVAWEKIVTTVTDSNAIINIINMASDVLNNIAKLFENDIVLIGTIITLSTLLLGNFISRYEVQKAQNRAILEENKAKLEEYRTALLLKRENAIAYRDALKKNKTNKEGLITALAELKAKAEANGNAVLAAKYEKEIALAKNDELNIDNALKQANAEVASINQELVKNRIDIWQTDVKIAQNAVGMTSIVTSLIAPISTIVSLVGTIFSVLGAINAAKATSIALEKQEQKEKGKSILLDKIQAGWRMAASAGAIPFIGWGIAISILAAIGIALAVNAAQASNSEAKMNQAADSVNKLSNEIYKLNERANAIKTLEDQYDALDKKIIKTAEDQAKMNELLDSAADKLDTSNQKDNKGKDIEGTSQQDQFKAIETEQEKLTFLQNAETEARDKANEKRQEQLDLLKALDAEEREAILTSKENTEYLKVQSAVRAINNNNLYEYIDTLEDVGKETEAFTQAILDQLTAEQQYAYATEEDSHSIQHLVNAVDKATTVINGQRIRWTDVLNSGDYSFNERIEAFDELRKSIVALNDTNLTAAFDKAYQQWDQLARNINDTARDFMDQVGMTIDRLNDWGLAVQKFGLSTEEAANRMGQVMNDIANGWTIGESIRAVFSDILDDFEEGSEDWLAAYNKLLNAYQSAMNVSILNMGQNLESLKNRVSNIYEQAQKWNTLSDTERTTFMNDNADLFSGEDGARLYEAFKTQNYNLIQQALENNKVLNDTIEKRKQELQLLLDIEQARADEDRNEGQIAYLKEQIRLLEETKDIYRASLKLRLEQEQSQLDIYKEYLQKQQDALSDSLEKRKEAYEKYFETINQEAEDEEYEEKAELLIGNLSKLAASDDASSNMQSAELEAQLRELEEERLKELRERAQQAVIQNIDDQLTQISEKFDKLLENNQLLLQAMTAQITGDPTGFVSQMLASGTQGMTALGAENYLEEFRATFGSILPATALENISISESTTGDTLILNIAGTEVEIGDSTQQELYLAIMRAMRQLGIK